MVLEEKKLKAAEHTCCEHRPKPVEVQTPVSDPLIILKKPAL